jgi:translation initiation factor 2 beta subunit (eIF-2beta)/eIF-5
MDNFEDDSMGCNSDVTYKNVHVKGGVTGKRIKLNPDEPEHVMDQRVFRVDVEKESEIDSTMKYLMKSLLHHQRLSGEYQGYINTFVQLRDYHEIRSEQLKRQLDHILKLHK